MLKTRVIPSLLVDGVGLVKGKSFNSDRRVGPLSQAVRVYAARDVDEMIVLDIRAGKRRSSPDPLLVEEILRDCRVPLTIGGGVSSAEQARNLVRAGADKISVNTAALERPSLVREIAEEIGSQSVVISIDALDKARGGWLCATHSGSRSSSRDVLDWSQECESLGAGEILITSTSRDGCMEGFDIELVKAVVEAVSVPVIASGGAGGPDDFVTAVKHGGAAAVAAASVFHFTELTPLDVKKRMDECGIPVRLGL